ncbi:MAG: energy-coupling factor transporter transmembrane protein EcfT [Actinomycetota bacterium]|nr:energy-coupling factor transporter transmembrane protein EcfT [Actinomycetota bacterium]
MTAETPTGNGRRHRLTTSVVFLREVPTDSPIHRLWAGTKLIAVAAISLTLSLAPSWLSVAMVAAFAVAVGAIARIPLGALPRFPKVFWAFLVFGAFLTLLAGGGPVVHVAGVTVGLRGIDLYARFTAVSFVLLGSSMTIGWTTPLGEIAPALARLGTPLRLFRIPVDEWAMAVALCVRSLPLLIDELRTLGAARRLRPPHEPDASTTGWQIIDELIDLVTAGLAVAMRRARELAEAITARGGLTLVPSRHPGPRRADLVALVATAALCGATAVTYATA